VEPRRIGRGGGRRIHEKDWCRVKLLIVGASGFIGRQAIEFARISRTPAVGTRATSGDGDLVRFDLATDRIADCLPRDFLEDESPVCAAVFASICQLDRCRRERETSYLVNVTKTIGLLDDLARLGMKPVFISSSYVFDGETGYYSEESTPNPVNEYGRQKLEVEQYIAANLPGALVLRLDKIVGDNPHTQHLFSEWDRCLDEGRPITCIEGQVLSPTLAGDVARALLIAATTLDMSGLYHVANPEFFSREDLARQFALATGREAAIISKPLEEFPFDDPRPLKSYLDGSKFTLATGMRFTSMSETFARFMRQKRAEQGTGGVRA
jgi:dTDP-4-dehydrorhamnose reductase